MLGNQASSRASSALALALVALAGLASAVAGCTGGSGATSSIRQGGGASLLTALAHVTDTADNRSWIWYDDTAAIARIAGTGNSPTYHRKGFGSLRGMGTGTSTLESAQAAKDTGIDIYNEGYSITAGTLPKEMPLVHGGQSGQAVTASLGALGWRDNHGTLNAPPPSDVMAAAGAPYQFILGQVKASGPDVKFGNSGTDLDEIGSPSRPTLASDPLITALANCLGDVVAAEFNVHGSYYGQPVGRGPVEVAIGVLRPPANTATPRTVVCAAWPDESVAKRYAGDVQKAISSETSITGKQRYSTELTNLTVTITGGGQHIVEWQADTPAGAGTVFGMMQLYDLPALPSCTIYGSCSLLSRYLIGVRVPALVGLPGAVLVASAPQCPAVAVGLVAAGVGDDGAAELPEQLGDGDGDQLEGGGRAVEGALAGGGNGEECVGLPAGVGHCHWS